MVGVGRECVRDLLRRQGTEAPLLVYDFILIRSVRNGGAMDRRDVCDEAESKSNKAS